MSVSPTLWAQIRLGTVPTPGLVSRVLEGEAVVLGETGALRARLDPAAQVLGAGPLEPLLADPLVTDVLVNATSGVWVDRGDGLTRTDCEVGDESAVRRLAASGRARRTST
jgi:pilus assembly protein CpaF